MNRRFALSALALLAAGAPAAWAKAPVASGAPGAPLATVTVYKNPSCGCCALWVEHLQEQGFATVVVEVPDTSEHRSRLGIPPSLASCHTAQVEGYGLEGHVPASEIKALLARRPAIKALAVPGMPGNAPGMGPAVGPAFDVMQVDAQDKVSVFSRWPRRTP